MEKYVTLTLTAVVRSAYFRNHGARTFDSFHLALAEETAGVFLTTDKELLKVAEKADTKIEAANPLAWLEKEMKK